ncbi:MAG: N-acetylmuramoyl-L-alanine amidase [Lachnospiraceae bacterium]|nr:N-acetylmuramoyl-L-alanine amidase [Lachnospiraceae bacterium]
MRKKIELILVMLTLAGLVMVSKKLEKYVNSDKVEKKEYTVVLDAGHGSSDSGKVGINGVLEKDINLSISKKTKKYLEKNGICVIMTRNKDESLAEGENGNRKVQDMKARVKRINDTKPDLAVSIHQNSYHEESIHGAQVFYYEHSESGEKDARILQEALLAVDPDNTRQVKANTTYYLLKRTEVPILIVECGFLSNQEEAEKLASEDYQKEIAKAIANGIESCLKD